MIWYAACDGNGTDSIDHVIAKNKDKITVREIDHYSQFESMINENISNIKPGDTFIVDTLSALANTARTDRVPQGGFNCGLYQTWGKVLRRQGSHDGV